jgi:cell shape-determining protein MreD
MKQAAALGAVGLLALIIQGALARVLAPPLCPDLGFLVVLGIGSCWRGLTSGLVLAAALGWTADLYSGSLFGQTALLRLIAFCGALLASRQLNLKGPGPLMLFTAGLTVVCGLASQILSAAFVGAAGLGVAGLFSLAVHAFVNALAAPAVMALVQRVWTWSSDEAGGRSLHIDSLRGNA